MTRVIMLASGTPGGTIGAIVEKPIVSGYSALQGAPLLFDGTNFVECGADPIQIAAFALTPGGADTSGYNILGRKEFPPLTMQGILPKGRLFSGGYTGNLPATTGGAYGLVRGADGVWVVDFTELLNTCVTYVGGETAAPESQGVVFFRVLDAVIQPII